MSDLEYINDWINKAEKDIKTVEIVKEYDEMTEIVCFHCQQAVEKYLKALLLSKNIQITRTHNIDYLLKQCVDFNEDFIGYIGSPLSEYAVDVRYLDIRYIPTEEETKDAIALMDNVVTLIKKELK